MRFSAGRIGRKAAFAMAGMCLGLLAAAGICEAVFAAIEYRNDARSSREGEGGELVPDGRWGWKPSVGAFRHTTDEFDARGSINSLGMNDVAYEPRADAGRTRILALGDSHTYAVGVSMAETWPKVLERRLNSTSRANMFRVYNAGVAGFNLHQYLLRLVDQGPLLKPQYVIVGLSYATDLYDLIPPDRGGWLYDNDESRDYFDFDGSGELHERRWNGSDPGGTHIVGQSASAARIRRALEESATFRYLRHSTLSLFIGSHVKVKGQTLWPNMEVVFENAISPQHEYQWRLFEALLSRIKEEAERQHATLVVVGIPYIAQVYDDIWQWTFGGDPRFGRTAAIDRVRSYCQSDGILYFDTLDAFRARTTELGRPLHYHRDGHPTPEGHEAIANAIAASWSFGR